MEKTYKLANGNELGKYGWKYLVITHDEEYDDVFSGWSVWLTDDLEDETDGYSCAGDFEDMMEELADSFDTGIITKTEHDEIVEEIRGW